MSEKEFAVDLVLEEGYRFRVDFGEERIPDLLVDETPPLGAGEGPNPVRLLAAAVGDCMSASLKFCLARSRIELRGLHTRVEGTLVRNDAGRLRVGELRVRLEPVVDPEHRERMGRCLEIFEDFCIVGQSVRQGVQLAVEVTPGSAPEPVGTH